MYPLLNSDYPFYLTTCNGFDFFGLILGSDMVVNIIYNIDLFSRMNEGIFF